MPKMLVVDDEPNVLYSIEKTFRSDTLDVIGAQTGAQAIELTKRMRPDLAILDVRLSDMSGLEVFDRIREIDPRLPVIIVTAYGATETAIEAMKRGAYEYLLKPIDLLQLSELIQRALELSRFRHVPTVFKEEEAVGDTEPIVGRSPVMQDVYKAIGRVASSDITVLITGESGTGKELVARALWQHSGRADKTFLAVNCAAIPEALLESELFGHEKGAFTGAISQKVGRLELADQGTLFLDEVGDIPPEIQPKLLRALQEREFERLGSTHTRKVNVRLIAATNRDLEKMIAEREFRSDLYYRLNVFPIRIPPLRERREDIPLLVRYFVQKSARQMQKQIETIPAAAMKTLTNWEWPGNIRELENFIERAVILTRGRSLEVPLTELNKPRINSSVDHRGSRGQDVALIVKETISALNKGAVKSAGQEYDEKQRREIVSVLQGTKGRVGGADGAAARMGINRTTLVSRMKKFGIHAKQFS